MHNATATTVLVAQLENLYANWPPDTMDDGSENFVEQLVASQTETKLLDQLKERAGNDLVAASAVKKHALRF